MPKGANQLDERVPIEVGTIQVNFCKNPQCQNFGIAASTTRQPRGRGAAQPGRDTYSVVGSGRGTPMLRCSFCGQYPTIKSNKVFYNFVEVGRNKQTPAMRSGLAKGKITVENIIYYQ